MLPGLHREVCGSNVLLFMALIPVAHFTHELFYRGYLQTKFTALLHSAPGAIALSAVLFAWTHVFVFSSPEIQTLLARVHAPAVAQALSAATVLKTVTLFTFVESVVGGAMYHLFGTLIAPVAFRSSNLITILLVVYPRVGLL